MLRARGEDVPPWDHRVKEERADLEVTKLRRERAASIRSEREERAARQREAEERRRQEEEQRREEDERATESRRAALAAADEQRRLDDLRNYNRSLALFAPTDYQVKVVRDLLRTLNSEDYPPSLGDYVA